MIIILVIFVLTLIYLNLNNKKNKFTTQNITFYKGKKYDLSSFLSKHPGGAIIQKAIGKDLETIWKKNNVLWHTANVKVLNKLKELEIKS